VRQYIALTSEKREIESRLRAVQDELNILEPAITDAYAEEGLQSLHLDGYTAYLQQELWASPLDGDYDRLCDELIGNGLADMVQRRTNTNTLSAWVREHRREGIPIPEGILSTMTITERYRVRVRRAS